MIVNQWVLHAEQSFTMSQQWPVSGRALSLSWRCFLSDTTSSISAHTLRILGLSLNAPAVLDLLDLETPANFHSALGSSFFL